MPHSPLALLLVWALLAWLAALVQTFLLVEPSEVLALVLIPSIADNACVVKCRTQLKDLGFI